MQLPIPFLRRWFGLKPTGLHPLHDNLLDLPFPIQKASGVPSPTPVPMLSPISDSRPSKIDWRRPTLGGQFETTLGGTNGVIRGAVMFSMMERAYKCMVDLCFHDQTVSRTWSMQEWSTPVEVYDTFTAKIQEAYREYAGTPYPMLGESVN